jgi:hypothetical protein
MVGRDNTEQCEATTDYDVDDESAESSPDNFPYGHTLPSAVSKLNSECLHSRQWPAPRIPVPHIACSGGYCATRTVRVEGDTTGRIANEDEINTETHREELSVVGSDQLRVSIRWAEGRISW